MKTDMRAKTSDILGKLAPLLTGVWLLTAAAVTVLQAAAAPEAPLARPIHEALYKADQLMGKNEYAAAAAVLEKFRRDGADHYRIHFTLGTIYLALERYQPAVAHLEDSLARKPGFEPAWSNLAKAYYDQKKYSQAGRCFLKSYDTGARARPEILHYAAASFLAAGERQKAVELWQRLLKHHPGEFKIPWREQLVHTYLDLDRPKAAIPHLKALIENSRGSRLSRWREVLMHHYLALKRHGDALKLARRLTREDPLDPRWWRALTHLHITGGRQQDALVALMITRYLTSLTAQETRLLADLNLALGIPVKAAEQYRQLLDQKIELAVVKRLVYANLKLSRYTEALAAANRGLKRWDAPELRLLKGRILFEQGEYRQALTVLQRLTEKTPRYGEAWLLMGYAAYRLDAAAEARAALASARKFAAHKQKADALLEHVNARARITAQTAEH